MNFRTEIIPEHKPKIVYGNKMFCIGSCFAENIGNKLSESKFDVNTNPFGILYNPISIADGLERILSGENFEGSDLFFDGELWHSWMHHGQFSSMEKGDCLLKINSALEKAIDFFAKTDVLIITLGTAFVYKKKNENKIVANCHKVPNHQFNKIRLDVEEIYNALHQSLEKIKSRFPKINVILTVSPVRHVRDGLLENQKSKSILLLAIEKLIRELEDVDYFPSYEIQMDELRDYRFYNPDLIHPNEMAIEYIWKKFRAAYFFEKTKEEYIEVMKIVQGFNHRVLQEGTPSHIQFVESQVRKATEIMKKIPVNFELEIESIQGK